LSHERRAEITAAILAIFASQPASALRRISIHPVAFGKIVMLLQQQWDFSVEEIEHVLIALCTRCIVNLIRGEVFFCGERTLLDAPADADRIDWMYAAGRYAH